MKWNVRLVNGSYRRSDRAVTVELFGRTDDGRSATILYDGFRPYFVLVEPPADVIEELESDTDAEMENLTLWVEGADRECMKVTVRFPWTVPDYRRRFSDRCQVMAADIPFYQRFIYDMDLGSCTAVEGTEVTDDSRNMYTTELVIQAESFLEAEPFKPPLSILSIDIENRIEKVLHDGRILVIGWAYRRVDGELETGRLLSENEGEMIRNLVELVAKTDPDVITGYNIEGYDLPFIAARGGRYGHPLAIGRDRSEAREGGSGGYYQRVKGRVVADAWKAVKREVRPKKETLGYVSQLLIGETKHDVDSRKMNQLWETERDKVVEYCINDAVITLKILEKLNVLDKGMDLATVSKVPLDDVVNGRTSSLIDSILIRKADRENIGVPVTHRRSSDSKIEGGYVHSIRAGLYHWVCVLDFKSMYPSVIIGNNICFTTLSDEGTIQSPIGVRFLTKDKREGLLPRILEDLMRQRDLFKRLRNEAQDEEMENYYNGLQDAVKILMNSFYGVFASSFYRFTDKNIGASITAFSRENIKRIIKGLEDEGYEVVYSDTDSIFVLSPVAELNGSVEFGETMAKRYTEGSIVLEFEKILDPLFSHGAKKRYVGKVVWPTEQMLVRGYETRRTDSFDMQTDALNEIFKLVLDGMTDEAVQRAKEIVLDIRKGNVEPERLVISRSCQPFETYKNPERLAWVQTAKKMMDRGFEFVPGMKVSWIVTNAKETPQRVEPFVDDVDFEYEPDWNYYAHRVATSLARVTDVFGWDDKALLEGRQQKTLGSFTGDEEDPQVHQEDVILDVVPEKKVKVRSLEDFL